MRKSLIPAVVLMLGWATPGAAQTLGEALNGKVFRDLASLDASVMDWVITHHPGNRAVVLPDDSDNTPRRDALMAAISKRAEATVSVVSPSDSCGVDKPAACAPSADAVLLVGPERRLSATESRVVFGILQRRAGRTYLAPWHVLLRATPDGIEVVSVITGVN